MTKNSNYITTREKKHILKTLRNRANLGGYRYFKGEYSEFLLDIPKTRKQYSRLKPARVRRDQSVQQIRVVSRKAMRTIQPIIAEALLVKYKKKTLTTYFRIPWKKVLSVYTQAFYQVFLKLEVQNEREVTVTVFMKIVWAEMHLLGFPETYYINKKLQITTFRVFGNLITHKVLQHKTKQMPRGTEGSYVSVNKDYHHIIIGSTFRFWPSMVKPNKLVKNQNSVFFFAKGILIEEPSYFSGGVRKTMLYNNMFTESWNKYRRRPFLINRNVLTKLLGSVLRDYFRSQSFKDIFGINLTMQQYREEWDNFIFTTQGKLLTHKDFTKTAVSEFVEPLKKADAFRKKAKILLFYADKQIPVYLPFLWDFRGRDTLCGKYFNPLMCKFSRAIFNFSYTHKQNVANRVSRLTKRGKYALAQYVCGLSFEKEKLSSISFLDFLTKLDLEYVITNDNRFIKTIAEKVVKELGRAFYTNDTVERGIDLYAIVLRNISQQRVTLDASASGVQLLAAITQDTTLATLTNMLAPLEDFRGSDYNNTTERSSKLTVRYLDVYTNFFDFAQHEDNTEVYPLLQRLVGNRALLKACIMQLLYGANPQSKTSILRKEFYKVFSNEEVKLILPIVLLQFREKLDVQRAFLKYMCKKHIQENDQGLFNFQDFGFQYTYIKKECTPFNFKYSVPDRDQDMKVLYKAKYFSQEINTRKIKSAFPANFMQSLDGFVKYTVYNAIKKKDIPVYCVHDAFIVHPNFAHLVVKEYNKALLKLADIFKTDYEQFCEDYQTTKDKSLFSPKERKMILQAKYSLNPFLWFYFVFFYRYSVVVTP